MEFEAYLADKKIDSEAFKQSEPAMWQNFKELFEQVHPNSFTAQKKFLINDLRRLYHLKNTPTPQVKTSSQVVEEPKAEEPKKVARPVIRKAPVIKKPDAESGETAG